jgi:SET domain-containing protein
MWNRLAFFATEFIKANTELCYDYGYLAGNVEGKSRKCLCDAEHCRQRMY